MRWLVKEELRSRPTRRIGTILSSVSVRSIVTMNGAKVYQYHGRLIEVRVGFYLVVEATFSHPGSLLDVPQQDRFGAQQIDPRAETGGVNLVVDVRIAVTGISRFQSAVSIDAGGADNDGGSEKLAECVQLEGEG